MTREEYCAKIQEAVVAFLPNDTVTKCEKYGNGHINDTFIVETETSGRFILQRMNHEIFTEPVKLIENVERVTGFLKQQILKNGGDANRETLNMVETTEGKHYFVDSIGSYWRMYLFIEDATSFDQVNKPEDFYESAVAFGNFQNLLMDFDAKQLYETIPNFHNTPSRYQTFLKAVEADTCNRADSVRKEIEFYLNHKEDMELCASKLEQGLIPLRVTHNDTKLNNIMIDNATGKGLCVIDLDTVMPGLAIFDFGDSIRFGANTAAEDEMDLSKVSLDLGLFEIYVKGYLEGCNGSLTEQEVELMPFGAKTMTLECGMRFLTDYLQGDTYFRVHRENHNLDRCRTQIALVEDMERKWSAMKDIVEKYK